MAETIGLFILLGSFTGVGTILYRKIPVLRELPRREGGSGLRHAVGSLRPAEGGLKNFVVGNIKHAANSQRLKAIGPEKILQKALSKIQVLAMKTENQTAEWLRELRRHAAERKTKFSGSYFDQFKKKTTKGK